MNKLNVTPRTQEDAETTRWYKQIAYTVNALVDWIASPVTTGNLGIKVTPNSNWNTTIAVIELKNNNVLYEGTGANFNIASNLYVDSGSITKYATANFGAAINVAKTSGAISLSTYPSGAANAVATPVASVTLNQTDFVMTTATGGIGYGTGSGGSVLQSTFGATKITGVTLNRPTGKITTNADALAAGARAVFILSNSLILATDIIVVAVVGGGGNYKASVVNVGVAGGAVTLDLTNVSAGSLSEAVVIQFAIIKGAVT